MNPSTKRSTSTSLRKPALALAVLTFAFTAPAPPLFAAPFAGAAAPAGATPVSSAPVEGSVADAKGGMISGATITARNQASGRTMTAAADARGHFSLKGLPVGSYDVTASAPGFAPSTRPVQLTADHSEALSFALDIGATTSAITVNADASGSIAAALAPMDANLETETARTEISQSFINNFTSPVADYGEAVEMAPGTFTTNGNGVGLGQSKTYFRGFADGSYDIDFDGIPFYDTNTPTHHSWAFFPTQFLGGIDFDRSPGTASTIGPTPFGGSIHLLSKELSPLQNVRGGFSYGSYNTKLFDGEYDSGAFGPGHKFNLDIDVHHLSSDGYQTFNFQKRTAGEIKFQYRVSEKTVITGLSAVIQLDANTPNFNPTRCQMYGAAPGYACTGTAAFFAGSGIRFLNTDNSDPVNYLDYQYNFYHVPTDFEYVGLHKELPHGFNLEFKGYTYNYDNSEQYTNATPITESATINGSKTYNGIAIAPCNIAVTKSGVTALPCGVDKYNSYRKYGETSELSQVSRFGIFRGGVWYEWANTNRHQYPTDPLNHYADQALPNFAEQFQTNSYQPFAEYEFHPTSKLNITPGVKFAYYTIGLTQHADDGKTVGSLCNTTVTPAVCVPFVTNSGSYFATLPSLSGNYRIKQNWSAYAQLSTGSIVPPSSVYDFNQTPTPANPHPGLLTPPKQQRSTTYQFGSVYKAKHVTFDADFYHIRFQNSYSSLTDPTTGEQVNYLQPSSITKGFEAESNLYLAHGFSAYLNATVGRATYTGTLNVTGALATAPQMTFTAPSGLWVANTPSDTETEGLTYQHRAFDVGLFNKRVGTLYQDNKAYHNQATINPFSLTNVFLNYTIHSGSHFDQTKVRLSFNNIFDEHNITSEGITGTALTQTAAANGTTYVNPFVTNGPTPIAAGDQISVLPGRSVTLSVTFGFSPRGR